MPTHDSMTVSLYLKIFTSCLSSVADKCVYFYKIPHDAYAYAYAYAYVYYKYVSFTQFCSKKDKDDFSDRL
jgi:hypothetical protein